MKPHRVSAIGAVSALVLSAALTAHGQIIADATLEVTYTLTDVTITDEFGNSFPATFETTNEVGDLIFEDIGPNSSTFAGEAGDNPPGSVGSASASEDVSLNGLDPFVDFYDQDSFGIGDSLVLTMNAFASAETPDSVFFAQVDSENTLFFSQFLNPTDQLTFSFDYSAEITGTLDSSALPGTSLVVTEDSEVIGYADVTEAGPPNSFLAAMDLFDFTEFNDSGVVPLMDLVTGSFDVAFDPGDDLLEITFLSRLVVNARVDPIPEPAAGTLVLGFAACFLARRRQR